MLPGGIDVSCCTEDVPKPTVTTSSSPEPGLASPRSLARKRSGKHTFKAAASKLDTQVLAVSRSELRGFVNLFWVMMAFYMISTFWTNFKITGGFTTWALKTSLTRDFMPLLLSDLAMITFASIAFPIVRLAILWHKVPMPLINLLRAALITIHIAGWLTWALVLELKWLQSGYFTLHVLVQQSVLSLG